ncbi:MAG TPA: GNAT family protein [Thermomicrobiales bacterium]|jgi:RimJ/RimL family protein N-acetyltransferase
MRAIYLTGETVYLRAMLASDKENAAAWYASPFPINATRAEEWLKEAHTDIWGNNKPRHYLIARVTDDEAVGSATLTSRGSRRGMLTFAMAPWRDDADLLRAEALRLIVPWVRDDLELMHLMLTVAADETATVAAAEDLGLQRAARLRGFVARPTGRVDRVLYEALNTPWRVGDA